MLGLLGEAGKVGKELPQASEEALDDVQLDDDVQARLEALRS